MPDRENWVDFKAVREAADFGAVLESYGAEFKLKGEQAHGYCPLPGHEGKRKSPSFSAHLAKKAFQCFGCGAKGNVLDFVALMEGLNPENTGEIRKAALILRERFLQGSPSLQPREPRPAGRRVVGETASPLEAESEKPSDAPAQDQRPRLSNVPLDFELRSLDRDHPYLLERRLAPFVASHFELGVSRRGMMAGRLAIPIHDREGRLVGYAGRLIDDKKIGPDAPKYLFPGPREKEGATIEFAKSLLLYNAPRVNAPVEDLIIVEGFFGVFSLHQFGWRDVVALMGSSCSEAQAGAIVRMTHFDARIWVMPDGDEAGRRCALSVMERVAPERFVRWVELEKGEQPDHCSEERLHDLLDLPIRCGS